MILLKSLLSEASGVKTVYRGVNPAYGDIGLGINSIKIGDKLVATLGPNHTDNIDVAKRFGKQIITTDLVEPGLELGHYNDIIKLYEKYKTLLTPGIAGMILNSKDKEQLELIRKAGLELRTVLKQKYGYVKSPLAVSDSNYLSKHGLTGNLYIPLI